MKQFSIIVKKDLYIGDLCYALNDDIYYGIWGAKHFEDGAYKTEKGLEFAMVGTAYGDGCYSGSDGYVYPVDAGNIGICDAELVEKDISDLGRIIRNVPGEVTITYDNGTISVEVVALDDTLVIPTGDEEEYEEDEVN